MKRDKINVILAAMLFTLDFFYTFSMQLVVIRLKLAAVTLF